MKRVLPVALLFYALGVLTIMGCATTFPWRFYAEQMPVRKITGADVGKTLAELAYAEGMLLGKTGHGGWPDISLNECRPDDKVKLKCMTLLVDDFYSLKADDEKAHADLDACQHGPKPK